MNIPKRTPVTLNEIEMRLAHCIGISRCENNRENNVRDRLQDEGADGVEKSIQGVMGEIAFNKLTNTFPDTVIHPKGQDTDVGDNVVMGVRFDVKTTKHDTGHLACVKWKNDNPQAYALMIGDVHSPDMIFGGFAWREELKKEENIKDFRNLGRPQYALPQDVLHHLNLKTIKRK
jgi:hypothetical protein